MNTHTFYLLSLFSLCGCVKERADLGHEILLVETESSNVHRLVKNGRVIGQLFTGSDHIQVSLGDLFDMREGTPQGNLEIPIEPGSERFPLASISILSNKDPKKMELHEISGEPLIADDPGASTKLGSGFYTFETYDLSKEP